MQRLSLPRNDEELRSLQQVLLQREMVRDSEIVALRQFPPPRLPGVVMRHVLLDFAVGAPHGSPYTAVELDPLVDVRELDVPGGHATEGSGLCFDVYFGDVWLPPLGAAIEAHQEIWLCTDAFGAGWLSHRATPRAVAQYRLESVGGRLRAVCLTTRHMLTDPRRLEAAQWWWSSPVAAVQLPAVKYRVLVTHDGSDAVLDFGAEHGLAVGDWLLCRGELALRHPHGAQVTAVPSPSTAVVESNAPAGTEKNVLVVVLKNWVRVPLKLRSLTSRVTNFTMP